MGAAFASAAAMTLAACGGARRDTSTIGASVRGDDSHAMHPIEDAGADAHSAYVGPFSDYRTSMTKLTPAKVSSVGHAGGRWDIVVYCNDKACRALNEKTPADEGAAFAVEHTEHAENAVSGPIMFMEKRAPGYAKTRGDWRYIVVGASGVQIADGPEASCADCHDEAPVDHMFQVGVVHAPH